MHQVFAIFLRDVKRILKNPVALVVTLGVAIIPSLYAWCNILANWDPYANTGNIQVAVANEDKGTTSEKPCQTAPFSRNYYSFDVPRTLAYLHVTDASKPLCRLYIHNFFLF